MQWKQVFSISAAAALLLTGCSNKSSLLSADSTTHAVINTDIFEGGASAEDYLNGVPASYISRNTNFISSSLKTAYLHNLALSDTNYCSLFISGSDCLLVSTGDADTASKLTEYLSLLGIKRLAIVLPDLSETCAGGLSGLLAGFGGEVTCVAAPVISRNAFTTAVYETVSNYGLSISLPDSGAAYNCFGYDLTFYYPSGQMPSDASYGLAMTVETSDETVMIISGNDTLALTSWLENSNLDINADILLSFDYSSDDRESVYSAFGGRYAYASYVTDKEYGGTNYYFSSSFTNAGYTLAMPSSDGTCVYSLTGELTIRSNVSDTIPESVYATEAATALDMSVTVYYDGSFYHSSNTCNHISALGTLTEMTRQTAADNGYPMCTACWQE